MRLPASVAAESETAGIPAGPGERFAGYGVMGLPFVSGHVLAMRRFPASSIGRAMPERASRSQPLLKAMGSVAGLAMRAEKLGLVGRTANGQEFVANPSQVWVVDESNAQLGDEDLGPPGPLTEQARVGDFWIPQCGVFAVGKASFHT